MKRFNWLIILMIVVWTLTWKATAYSQEQPPERLDTITLRHYVITAHTLRQPTPERLAVLYVSNGFGTIQEKIPSDGWPILNADESPAQYVWFRIPTEDGGEYDDFWLCVPETWDNYASSGDVEALKNASWHFARFHTSSTYTIPPFVEPVTWERRSEHLTVGYTSDNTLVVVRMNDDTGRWEWTIRGVEGRDNWQAAPSRGSAMIQAEDALRW